MSTPQHTITAEEVRKVARLARLAIDEGDVERFRGELAAVLGHAAGLQELDLTGVMPMTTPAQIVNRLGDDVPGPTLPTDVLMAMAPSAMPPYVRVPKVLGGGGSA